MSKLPFLYGPLEEVFLAQPEGFNDGTGKVCKLHKGLYCRKQSPRQWNGVFHKFLLKHGFKRSPDDLYLYKYKNKEERMYLCLYGDDGLVFVTSQNCLERIKQEFDVMTDEPHTYVGLSINRDRRKGVISVNQAGYFARVLHRKPIPRYLKSTSDVGPIYGRERGNRPVKGP
jgi:hypothetical protein